MKLFELQSTLDWEWKMQGDDSVAMFRTPEGKLYTVEFNKGEESTPLPRQVEFALDRAGDDVYETSFSLRTAEDSVTQQTGTGESFTVFAAVMDIIRNFVNSKDPDALYFAADPSEQSRVKLYDAIAKRYQAQGWDVETIPMPGLRWYIMSR